MISGMPLLRTGISGMSAHAAGLAAVVLLLGVLPSPVLTLVQ
jgi:hypothetical protein